MTAVGLLLRSYLTVLRCSPLLLGALLAYPVVIALLVGLVAGYASSKPARRLRRRGINVPPVVQVPRARASSHVQSIIDEVSQNVTLVPMSAADARRELASGQVPSRRSPVPPGFVGALETTAESPSLVLRTGTGAVTPRVTQQVQALVYRLNRQLQGVFIRANLVFVRLILHGGSGSFLGRPFTVLGLDRTEKLLATLPQSQRVTTIRNFIHTARAGLARTGTALREGLHPRTRSSCASRRRRGGAGCSPRRCSRTGSRSA